MKSDFENIYDVYCPVLYGIALQLCPTEVMAEDILVKTFQTLYQKKSVWQEDKHYCIPLIKLMIGTVKEQIYLVKATDNFKIKEFENTPFLHQLLVEQLSIENYCSKNNITRQEAVLMIRDEFKLIRNLAYRSNSKIHNNLLVTGNFNN